MVEKMIPFFCQPEHELFFAFFSFIKIFIVTRVLVHLASTQKTVEKERFRCHVSVRI